ncbi:MAG: hypothetical protein QJR14_02965 [Bacillota bacterium]|nr:hypothetical protein [Bacillota bacterium]
MTELEMIQEAIAEAKRLRRGAVVKAFVPAAAEPSYTMIPPNMPAEFYQLQESYRIAKAERYLRTSLEHVTAIAKATAKTLDAQESKRAKNANRRSALEEALRKLDELDGLRQKLAHERKHARKSREQRREAMNRAAAKRRQAELKDDEDDEEYGYPEPENRPVIDGNRRLEEYVVRG